MSLGAIATPALAQGGFTDYRQAATDQYGSASSNPPGAAGKGKATKPKKKSSKKHKSSKHKTTTGTSAPSTTRPGTGTLGNGFSSPVPVSNGTNAPTGKGQLPYTGGPLGVLVLIALAFLAAGFLLAAALRLRRPRDRGASA